MCSRRYNLPMGRTFNYKGVKVNAFGLPIWLDESRAKKKDRKRKFYHLAFSCHFTKDAPKNLIVMYDITDDKKKERDWFRRHLQKFNYEMIQRSVWVGPSPLPKDFLDYVKAIGLKAHLKTFKLAKSYTGKEGNI
ncbi:MAG: hypothetical protein UT98_C0001G0058 [Candidatus Nomurabacteria bacterium GW2011_GWF2_40_31]|uniref:Transcriptional repressor PaaX-like central Cas2-like domain-containing protein n=2 Tax=Candidatus Nomuraibacteriota TaxID=1752729 RepID=A0A837HRG2_9BACT|nr:MAG: hypothetical protein UT27_C0011G0011 [Candidatus Nomurabacteria bacterium GW2011_GWD2_39_12]KKR20623.1 MAG: hypothetical protein UT51_C0002G0058 [Candidatus Nomurabacteria bacterium GW2011_GWC2_39_41]KKR37448.1 MAG: hypothetical protein UT70_C0001G0124 [Candidatus Nomurabacteria bacterium GW2011_GWE2_40_10]KKR38696.1 MAG: hypothetical protein UT73_C0002G0181 [Candidatus Nomurabacteria bacterium GW2011_GWB1_40_11]KKR40421.1 MAG: hypothetical protein UT74_C0001G0155 [Parcubacteria group b